MPDRKPTKAELRRDAVKWWVVALVPGPVARWIWETRWVRMHLGSWTPHFLGQAWGIRGVMTQAPRRKGE